MSEARMNGRVKWFDTKRGYGFVESTGESREDVFVHFSNIKTDKSDTYKKLFPGEYVSFVKVLDDKNGRNECREVTGVDGGPLMTENMEFKIKVFKNYNSSSSNDAIDPETSEPLNTEGDELCQ